MSITDAVQIRTGMYGDGIIRAGTMMNKADSARLSNLLKRR
jgi:hypothetical protein